MHFRESAEQSSTWCFCGTKKIASGKADLQFCHRNQSGTNPSLGPNRPGKRKDRVRNSALKHSLAVSSLILIGLSATGCQKKPAPVAAGAGMQAMPVQTATVTLAPVPQSSEYVATIKSRRSATMQPQVDGRLTQILVRSGDHVKPGQVLMSIDPQHQEASVDSARATERQKKALFDYNTSEIGRQRKLFEAGDRKSTRLNS